MKNLVCLLLIVAAAVAATAQVTIETISPPRAVERERQQRITEPAEEKLTEDDTLTAFERRWLPELRTLPSLPKPHPSFGDAGLFEHPQLLTEYRRIVGVWSLGKWTNPRSADEISAIHRSGLPVAINWSPAERRRITVPPGQEPPAGAIITNTDAAGNRTAWVINTQATGPIHRLAEKLAWLAVNHVRVEWLILDDESDCKWMTRRQLADQHDEYERLIWQWYPDAKIVWYTAYHVGPSQGAIGRSASPYTTGTERAHIASPSLYSLDLARIQDVMHHTAQHAGWHGVTRIVPWISPTGAYLPTYGHRGRWVQDAHLLHTTPEVPYTLGWYLNGARDPVRWPGTAGPGSVGVEAVVFYRGPEPRDGWFAYFVAYCQGARLNHDWREAHATWDSMDVAAPHDAETAIEINGQPEMIERE